MSTSEGGWGYPPMATLQGAVPGWPEDRALTSAATPQAARAVLQAERETSVLHASGLRWLVARRVGLAVFLLVWLFQAVTFVGDLIGGDEARLAEGPVVVGFIALVVTRLMPWAWLRVDPSSQSLPPTRKERLRLGRSVLRGDLTTASAVAWPAGSEAYALLATAAMAREIDRPWLLDRAALPSGVGSQWLEFLDRCGWLSGGDASFGRWLAQPVKITDAGSAQLEAERDRLRALATS